MKYQSNTHDAMPPPIKRTAKPGKIGANKIGVYDHGPDGELRLRGQCGHAMTSSGVSRFHGKLGSKIQIVAGKKAWVASDRNVTGAFGSAQRAKLASQLRTDKGSVKR